MNGYPNIVRDLSSYATVENGQFCQIFSVMCQYGPINVLYIQECLWFCLSIPDHSIICFYRASSMFVLKQDNISDQSY